MCDPTPMEAMTPPEAVSAPPYAMKPQKRRLSAVGWSIVLFFLLPQILLGVVSFLAMGTGFATDIVAYNVAFYIALYAISLPLVVLILSTQKSDPMEKRSISFPVWLLFFVLGLGLTFLGALLTNFIMSFAEQAFGVENTLDKVLEGIPLPLVAFMTLVCAPVGEELVFRKLLIDRLRRYGTVLSVTVSALFFSLFHLNLYQMLYAFLMGLLLGYLYEKTGKLRYTVLLHLAVNAFGSILPMLLQGLMGDLDPNAPVPTNPQQWVGLLLISAYELLMLGAVVATCVLLAIFLWKRMIRLDSGSEPLSKGQKLKLLFNNPGMIFAWLCAIGLNLMNVILIFSS